VKDPVQECYIQGIGTAVPPRSLNAEQSAELLQQACLSPRSTKLFQRIARLTGIEKRHLAVLDYLESRGEAPFYRPPSEQPQGPGMGARTALFDQAAPPLVRAVLDSLSRDQLSRVGRLVTVSCTHASSPGLERPVLAHGTVPADAQRWNLGFMGCSAGLAAVRLLHGMVDSAAPALVVACELSSLHFQYTDALDQMTANVLFADGAAGILLSSRRSPIRIIACRCATFPAVADQMVWFAGDHGLQLRLSQELPETLAANVPDVVGRFLEDYELAPADIDHWLIHPGGPQILDSVERSLNLPTDALQLSRSVLRKFGNMSSPTIFFILQKLLRAGKTGRVVAMAFGPGLAVEMVLVEVVPA
jgi:predicted naringenin-chalcone synthase